VAADAIDILALTRALVDIDSTTGREGAAGRWLADYLRAHGWAVLEQRVDAARFNVIATSAGASAASASSVTFSTHFDCVPPFFPSRIEGDRLYGRGSCDAKGILGAQVAAADRLRRDGESRVALVFVVGEERGSDGARLANEAIESKGSRFLIDGEPTDNRLGLATRGILRLRLRASGRAAHSSFPELGESAIDKLLDALIALRSISLPADDVLGTTH
jgi:acetylornithine deacetylase